MRLELQDESGRTIARHEEHFTTAQPQAAATEAKSDSNGANKAVTPRDENFARAAWRIPVATAGYYRVRAEVIPTALEEKDGRRPDGTTPMPHCACTAAIGLAIVDWRPLPPGSELAGASIRATTRRDWCRWQTC